MPLHIAALFTPLLCRGAPLICRYFADADAIDAIIYFLPLLILLMPLLMPHAAMAPCRYYDAAAAIIYAD